MSRRSVSTVRAGAEFGPVEIAVDRERLVAYAAASGDHNRIHWDEVVARSVGLPGVIAHGMWTMGAAAALVADWAGDPTAVVGYRTKFTAPVVVPATGAARIVARGRVKSVTAQDTAEPRALVELTVTCNDQQVLNRAQATVRLAPADPSDPSGASGASDEDRDTGAAEKDRDA